MVARPKTTELDLPYRVLSPEEGHAFFDDQARYVTGLSGEEFIAKWETGAYFGQNLDATPEGRLIAGLALLIPFARQNS